MSHSNPLPNFQGILRLAVLPDTPTEDTFQVLPVAVQGQHLQAGSSWGAAAPLKSSRLARGEGDCLLITELTISRFSKTRPFQECPLFSSCSIQSLSLFACNLFLLKALPQASRKRKQGARFSFFFPRFCSFIKNSEKLAQSNILFSSFFQSLKSPKALVGVQASTHICFP